METPARSEREKLIEAARRLLADVNPKHRAASTSQMAEDVRIVASAVLGEAHAPTNDEQEAQYVCDTCGEYTPCSCTTDHEVGSDREDIWDEAEPQREPSDAQVKAALDAFADADFYAEYPESVKYWEPSMRAALRAATAVVTEQGENRHG